MKTTILAGMIAGAVACSSNSPDQPGVWGSDQASLTVEGSTGMLRILASGGCYGSYGTFAQRLPSGAFNIPGTYSQLIGAYPGRIDYAAQFSGTTSGQQITLTVSVPDLHLDFGPYTLTHGLNQLWPACAYP
ncbi:MAG: hypothetical protein ACHQ2E_01205 [Gemmatimonadales bacterium]